jgi:PhzF family phenazine biosynthesis protein
MLMRTITVEFVDAFIDGGVGGNVAGIVLEGAAELSTAQRQDIARQAAVSETAFVLPSDTADYKLEFYTPTRSIPHCGHATVGTFARLAETGRLKGKEVVNETVDGPRRIRIQDGRAFLEQVPVQLTTLDDPTTRQVLASLRIGKDQLLPDGGPFLSDNGNRSIQIGIAETDVLRSIRPDMNRVRDITNHFDAVCYYAFSLTSVTPGRDATARMFGPAYGIPEESATGMAAGPLACWLDAKTDGRRDGFSIEQGHMMSPASPSLILAQPERSGRTLTAMWIGGGAKIREMQRFSIA